MINMNLQQMNPRQNSCLNFTSVHLELQSFPERLRHTGVEFMKKNGPVKSPLVVEAGECTHEIHSSAADNTVRSKPPITGFDDDKSPMPASILKKRGYQRRNSVTDMLHKTISPTLGEGNRAHFSSEDLAYPPAKKRRFQRRNSATAAMLIAGLSSSQGGCVGKEVENAIFR